MKHFFLLLLLPFFTLGTVRAQGTAQAASQTSKAGGFTVNGNIVGLGDGEVKITTIRGDKTLASGRMRGGAFSLSGNVAEPGLYYLAIGKQDPQYLFLENTAVKISGTKANFKNLKIEGPSSQKDFALFEKTFNPLFASLNALVSQINAAPEAGKAELMAKYSQAITQLQGEVEKFIAPRRASFVSLFVISVTMPTAENIAVAEKQLASLSETVRNSNAGKELAAYIAYAKVGSVGSDAVDFTQNDVNDKPVSLSSFRGKYVLVDFWASWCRPCRAENPNVVRVFNRFKDKNFTVLGVSLDQRKDAWVQAIEKDNLTWNHVSDLQYWSNAAAQLYHVQSIPQNFLIDPSGKIVAKDLRGEDLEKKLCEFLGCSN